MTRLVLSVILVTITLSSEVRTDTVFSEARVSNRRILTLSDSPYFIENDVLVEDTGELVIEPGVTLKFGPGAGITVRGILRAEGLPDNKIVFTSAGTETERQENRTMRLVDKGARAAKRQVGGQARAPLLLLLHAGLGHLDC